MEQASFGQGHDADTDGFDYAHGDSPKSSNALKTEQTLMVLRGPDLLRVKGIVNVAGELPERRASQAFPGY